MAAPGTSPPSDGSASAAAGFAYDILVIGGGINGTGIARDAVGRGFRVGLAEKNDLASGTSSASTKLIHGGLRYLEHYEFRLVREALIEREVLWTAAPHIIWPLRFVLPHHKGLRPAWMLRLGLFLYDHIGGRKRLPPHRPLDLRTDPAGRPLKPGYATAFEYSDCWVQDARLVVLNARDAAARGADIMTRTECTRLSRAGNGWRVVLTDRRSGATREVTARLVVNAAGPWADRVLAQIADGGGTHNVRLVKGSHVVVPRLFDDPRCYIFQNSDGRVIFAIPYEGDFTLIGTTDRDFEGDLDDFAINDDETAYLCAAASEYFRHAVKPADVVWSYSGVRPLYDDGATRAQEATRDYVLKTDGDGETGAILNVFGGKITTYRRLAEEALEEIERVIGKRGPAWTQREALPGGDFPAEGFDALVAAIADACPGLPDTLVRRLVRNYGTEARTILGAATSMADLGRGFGADLTEAEIRYLVDAEWAETAEDVVWRRSKLGLRLTVGEIAALDSAIADMRRGAEPGGAEPEGAEPGGAEPGGAEPGGAEPGGAELGGAEQGRADAGLGRNAAN